MCVVLYGGKPIFKKHTISQGFEMCVVLYGGKPCQSVVSANLWFEKNV